MRQIGLALKFLIGIIAFVAVVMILLLSTNLGIFKGIVENQLSDLLGREVAVPGKLDIQLGEQIEVYAEDVTIANAEWALEKDFVRINSIDIRIDTWSLFTPVVQIQSLQLEGIEVNLESDASGNNNWILSPSDQPADNSQADLSALPAMIVAGSVKDLRVRLKQPKLPQAINVTASDIQVAQNVADMLVLELKGDVNQIPVEFSAQAGPVGHLIELAQVDVNVSGRIGEVRIEATTTIDNLLQPRAPTARLELNSNNTGTLTDALGLSELPAGSMNLLATLTAIGAESQLLVKAELGDFSMNVKGQFKDLQHLQHVELDVSASGTDSSHIAHLFGIESTPADPYSLIGSIRLADDRVIVEGIKVNIGDSQLDIQSDSQGLTDPRNTRAKIHASGSDLGHLMQLAGMTGWLSGPFTLDAQLTQLKDGGLSVQVNTDSRDLKLHLDSTVSGQPDFVGTRTRISASGPNLQTITAAAGLAEVPAEAFELSALFNLVTDGVQIETGTLSLSEDQLSLTGLIGREPTFTATDIQFELQGPNFAKSATGFGKVINDQLALKYRASGRIESNNEHLNLHNVEAVIGASSQYKLTVDGQISTQPGYEGSRINLKTHGASLRTLLEVMGIDTVPDLPFEASAAIERLASGINIESSRARIGNDLAEFHGFFSDSPMDGDAHIFVEVRTPNLRDSLLGFGVDEEAIPADEFTATGQIRQQNKHIELLNWKARLAGADVRLSGNLGTLPELEGTNISLAITGTYLSRLLPPDERFSALNQAYGFSAKITLNGKELSLVDAEAYVGDAKLRADGSFLVSPVLSSGHFSLAANAPDLYNLYPGFAEFSAKEVLSTELHISGNWTENTWVLDRFLLEMPKAKLSASGGFDSPPDFKNTDLLLELDAASLKNFSLLAQRELPDEPARVRFRLKGAAGVISLEEFEGAVGDSVINEAEFSFRYADIPEIHLGLASNRINLKPFLPAPHAEAGSESGTPDSAIKKDRLIPDTAIPTELLKKYKASFDIRINELNLPHRTLNDLVAIGSLDEGVLHIKDANLRSSNGDSLSADFEMKPVASGVEALLAVLGKDLTFGLPVANEGEVADLPKYNIDLILNAQGATLRELAGSSNGYISIIAGKGKVPTTSLELVINDFLMQMLQKVNPFTETDPYTRYECTVVQAKVENGNIVGAPGLVAQTSKLRALGDGRIDLKTENLELNFELIPRKGIGISINELVNPFSQVSGTLMNPTLTINPESAMIKSGVAVATGGLSILAKGLKNRFLSSNDPCGEAVTLGEPMMQSIRRLYYPEQANTQPSKPVENK